MSKRLSGEGTIYQDAQGYWVAEMSMGRNLQGNRLRLKKKSKTKAQAQKNLREMQYDKSVGFRKVSSDTQFMSFAESWLDMKRESHNRATTVNNYEYLLRHYVAPYFTKSRINNIDSELVNKWLRAMLAQNLSVTTCRRARQTLNSILNYAVEQRLISMNPCTSARVPRPMHEKPSLVQEPLTLPEAQHLLDITQGTYLNTVLTLAILLGLRRGEIMGLKWHDINWDARTLRIQRTVSEGSRVLPDGTGLTRVVENPPKTKSSNRTLKLAPAVHNALKEQLLRQRQHKLSAGISWQEDGYVFATKAGGVIYPTNMAKQFTKLLKKHNLRHIRFHDLRHTSAVLMLVAQARLEEVSQALGHSSIQITKDTYAPYVQNLSDSATDSVADLFLGSEIIRETNRTATGDLPYGVTDYWKPER